MRVIKKKNYFIGGKIPYSQWPELIHRYMSEQGLTSQKFLYHFSDLVSPQGCSRLMKDLPEIGTFREFDEEGWFHTYILTNIDTEDGCSEAQILPLMKKIHRSYGITACDLYYMDVDFFSDLIPSGRSLERVEAHYRGTNLPVNPLFAIDLQPYGSGFHLHRDCNSENYLGMSVDILHNGVIKDPDPYFSAMEKLLPGIRSVEMLEVYPTDEEQNIFYQQNKAAMPVIKRCRDWLDERLPGVSRQNSFCSNYSLAPKLKKLAKKYGFNYSYAGSGLYTLEHRTEKGHIFQFVADSGPSRYDTSFSMSIQGLDFYYILCVAMFVPTDQAEFDACADKAAEVANAFKNEMLPLLDNCWPETPDWYIPTWYPTIFYSNSD